MRPSLALTCVSTLALFAACAPTGEVRSTAEPAPVAAGTPAVAGLVASETAPDPGTVRGTYAGAVRRGVVTAGDIDDQRNLAAFTRYLAGAGLGLPQLGLGKPVLVSLMGPNGKPAPGVRYTLRKPGAAEPFHEGYSGPGGEIVDFPQVLGAGALGRVEIRTFNANGQELRRTMVRTGKPTMIALQNDMIWQPDFMDLVLVVDTTGSMGDEIAFLQRELIGVTRAAARKADGLSIRYGLVAYRDQGDDYVVKTYGFTDDSATMAGWLRGLNADGGGDYPEAAAAALAVGVGFDWRAGKGERLILHVADAPPHDGDAGAYLRAAKAAAEQGVQIFTLGASGVAAESEYLMRQAAVATGGRYLFLTDDSGLGYAHAEPTIPCYRVTQLSKLLTRVLMAELSGQRQEAPSGEVIREVGSYNAGVCRN